MFQLLWDKQNLDQADQSVKIIQHGTFQVTQFHQRHILHLWRIDDLANAVHMELF